VKVLVVFVHGLWFTGHEAFLLRRRLAASLGAEERNFPYHSMAATVSDSAAALAAYLGALRADTVHLVGHSMGGLVILQLFEQRPALAPGRIVLLGPPIQGSCAAEGLARLPLGRRLLGRGIDEAVLSPAARRAIEPRRWAGSRDVGIIAGRASVGLGRLVARLPGPNDGIVTVEETRLPGATDHIVLDAHHAGLLFSRAAARQAAAFLATGSFER